MGRWTPLVLMAGGLAILLGTLLGISFPMDGRNAQAPTESSGKESSVLPANINVNSTTAKESPAGANGNSTVAQNTEETDPSKVINPANKDTSENEQKQESTQTTTQNQKTAQGNGNGTGGEGTGDGTDGGNSSEPIRALW